VIRSFILDGLRAQPAPFYFVLNFLAGAGFAPALPTPALPKAEFPGDSFSPNFLTAGRPLAVPGALQAARSPEFAS